MKMLVLDARRDSEIEKFRSPVIGNRCSKRRRHKMLAFGRSGAVLEALKKGPRTYEGV